MSKMPKASACVYGSTGNTTISAAAKQLESHCGKLAVRGLSVYTPTTDPTYAKDLMAQVLHQPNFSAGESEESRQILSETNHCHQWWVANIGRMVCPTLTKINGKSDKDFSTESLYSAIPKFPDLPITPSSLTSSSTIETSFSRSRITSDPMNVMCDLGFDNDSKTKNMYTVLKPTMIIYMARRVLSMPKDSETQQLHRCDMALDVLACANAALKNLEVFASEKFTQEQFRKMLIEHGPIHATSLDVRSPQVAAIIKKASQSGVDFSTVSNLNAAHKICWFVGRLLKEWMDTIRVLMVEACSELQDYMSEKELLLELELKEKRREEKRWKRQMAVAEYYSGNSFSYGKFTYHPSEQYFSPIGSWDERAFDTPQPTFGNKGYSDPPSPWDEPIFYTPRPIFGMIEPPPPPRKNAYTYSDTYSLAGYGTAARRNRVRGYRANTRARW